MNTLLSVDKMETLVNRMPRWSKTVIGIALIALGLVIITKPFDSIGLMVALLSLTLIIDGVTRILNAKSSAHPPASRFIGALIALAGLTVLLVPALSINIVVIVVGVSLVISGITDIFSAINGDRYTKAKAAITGLAMIIFGLLALMWQDVALLIIAVAFSIKIILSGIALIANSLRDGSATQRPRFARLRRVAGLTGSVLLLALAFILLSTSNQFRSSKPVPDAFYSYNEELPSTPGQLLKSEPFTKAMPEGVRGWRILYTTTADDSNNIILASAFVMAPNVAPQESQPVVAWTHGTTGFAPGCAPTVMDEPMPLDNTVPGVQELINNGWVMVGTDYAGLGTQGVQPYLIGQGEGRSALDSVRAARQLSDLNLDDRTVVWGHSQGGGAALWAGQIAQTYAPDVNIMGVVAAAPASNIPALLDASKNSAVGKIMGTFALRAYSETYPDVKWADYIDPKYDLIAREVSDRCLAEESTPLSILQTLIIPGSLYKTEPTTGAFGKRMQENIPTGPMDIPIFIAQGEIDNLVLPDIQAAYAKDRCAAGQQLDYRIYPGKDHISIVDEHPAFNKDLEQWTRDRLAGQPITSSCE